MERCNEIVEHLVIADRCLTDVLETEIQSDEGTEAQKLARVQRNVKDALAGMAVDPIRAAYQPQ